MSRVSDTNAGNSFLHDLLQVTTSGAPPPRTRIQVTKLGWALGFPRATFTELDVVTVYKAARVPLSESDISDGWMLCAYANDLKKSIASAGGDIGASGAATLEKYVACIDAVRQFVRANQLRYEYTRMPPIGDLDYELYMVLSQLAAVYVRSAHEKRTYESSAGLVSAARHYAMAGAVLAEAHRALCVSPPLLERLGAVQPAAVPRWLQACFPECVDRGEAGRQMQARAMLMICESKVCFFQATLVQVGPDGESDFAAVLAAQARFIAAEFERVANVIGRVAGETSHRMLAYATLMCKYFMCRAAVWVADSALGEAAESYSPAALSVAVAELEKLRVIGADERAVVDHTVAESVLAAETAVVRVQKRCSDLRAVIGRSPDVSDAIATAADAEELVDPGETYPDTAPAFTLETHRVAFERANPRFAAFLRRFRPHDTGAAAPVDAAPLTDVRAGRRSIGDAIAIQLAHDMGAASGTMPPAAAQAFANGAVMAQFVHAVFNLGRLAERNAWLEFSNDADEEGGGGGAMTEQLAEVHGAFQEALAYFSSLSRDLGLSSRT